MFDDCIFVCKRLIWTNFYAAFMGTSESYAAQRALEWASEYKTMENKLKRAVVTQLFKEYYETKENRGACFAIFSET